MRWLLVPAWGGRQVRARISVFGRGRGAPEHQALVSRCFRNRRTVTMNDDGRFLEEAAAYVRGCVAMRPGGTALLPQTLEMPQAG